MTLTPHEYQRLQALLRKEQNGTLTPLERGDLKSLVTKQNPHAQDMEWEKLVELGLILLGAYLLLKALQK